MGGGGQSAERGADNARDTFSDGISTIVGREPGFKDGGKSTGGAGKERAGSGTPKVAGTGRNRKHCVIFQYFIIGKNIKRQEPLRTGRKHRKFRSYT